MKKLMEMMSDKKEVGGSMDKEHLLALRDVLDELISLSSNEAGKRVKTGLQGLQKVTVAAPDQESLEEGLEKAKDIVEGQEAPESDLESEEGMKESALNKIAEENSSEEEEDEGMKLFGRKRRRML